MYESKSNSPRAQRTLLSLRGVVSRSKPAPEAACYVVWGEGRRGPRVRYPDKATALREADRLAQLDPGRRFDCFALVLVGRALR